MLEKLILEIRAGGTLQPAALAANLNVSIGLMEMMLEELERRGLLTRLNTGCNESCGGCALVGECAVTHPQGRTWMLSGKHMA